LFDLANVAEHVCSIIGDIRDLSTLQSAIDEKRPEIVIHMAAQPLVRRSYHDPVETFSTNVMGTVNVLESIRFTNTARVGLVVTSDKCYENREWLWPYRENEPLGGYDPYSSSKACAEIVTAAYRKSFFSNVAPNDNRTMIATARAGNVIGGGDWAEDRLVPDIIRAFEKGNPLIIRNPAAVRPWQHVLDPLNGYLMLIERLWEGNFKFADAWNFGPDNNGAKPVAWVVSKVADLWGEGADWSTTEESQPHEAHNLALDSTKARTVLRWEPTLTTEDAIKWTVEWYRDYSKGIDARKTTLRQLNRFQEMT
jgi:CDP-glucose 4,6-dehydratase